ncbi:MAG: tetratricopeptide repeat protein [Myxococcaceae bacterium]
MADLDKELSDIRREVIESRNLVIRADNQLKTLHAEVKTVGRRLDEAIAQQRLSSVAAYVLFAVLAVGAGLVISVVRSTVATHERERLGQQLSEATAALEQSRAQLASAAAASRSASDVYKALPEGSPDERLKAVLALSRVDQAHLSPLERRALQERVEVTRREVGALALERGRQASRRGDAAAASGELTRFLALDPPEPEALEASFLLGSADARAGRPKEAIPLLSRVVDKDKNEKRREEAMALLALAYEQTGQPERAAQLARSALETAPESPWAPAFRSRLAAARRALGADAGPPAVPTAPAAPPHPTGVISGSP